jgi:hypothetical protein
MMIGLYRGIVDILINQTELLNKQFVKHIRTFNEGDPDAGFGTAGFWNLLLEVSYIFYVKAFVALGVLITISLAIVFFPLYALRMAFNTTFSSIKMEHQPMTFEEPKMEPVQEKK